MLKSIADKNDMEIKDKSKIPCHPFPYLVAVGLVRAVSVSLCVAGHQDKAAWLILET